MGSSIILSGKKFISARRGAEIAGYSSDYVGQLCRAGRVDAQMVGKVWFVGEESLLEHKKEAERLLLEMRQNMSNHRPVVSEVVVCEPVVAVSLPTPSPFVSYVPTIQPRASYIGKVVWMMTASFVIMVIASGAEFNKTQLAVYLRKSVSDVATSVSVTTGREVASAFSSAQKFVVAARDTIAGIHVAPTDVFVYDQPRTHHAFTHPLEISTGALSVATVADALRQSQSRAGYIAPHASRAELLVSAGQTEKNSASRSLASRLADVLDRVADQVASTEATFVSAGVSIGKWSDATSARAQQVGKAIATASDRASESLIHVGIAVAQFSDTHSQSAQHVGQRLALRVDQASAQMQSVGRAFGQISDGASGKAQMAGVALATFSGEMAHTANVVGKQVVRLTDEMSGEFYFTGQVLASVSDGASRFVQHAGQELVRDISVVRSTVATVGQSVASVMAAPYHIPGRDLAALSLSAPLHLLAATEYAGVTIAQSIKVFADTTYRYAKALVSPRTYIALFAPRNQPSVLVPEVVSTPSPRRDGALGIAVVPKKAGQSAEAITRQIKNAFSDEVTVHPDESGTSGIIKPVFKKVVDDQYVYVLVPINQQ